MYCQNDSYKKFSFKKGLYWSGLNLNLHVDQVLFADFDGIIRYIVFTRCHHGYSLHLYAEVLLKKNMIDRLASLST